jgi:hypothetical protein
MMSRCSTSTPPHRATYWHCGANPAMRLAHSFTAKLAVLRETFEDALSLREGAFKPPALIEIPLPFGKPRALAFPSNSSRSCEGLVWQRGILGKIPTTIGS